MKSLLVLIVTTATLFGQSALAPPSGHITGDVIDQNGRAVSNATVYAISQDAVPKDVTSRSVKTDSHGRFDFHGGLEFGTYKLYAQKDADGYLTPQDAFYADADNAIVEVTLTRKHPASAVTIRLGKQAAIISGKVFDVDSGAPLTAYIGLMDDDGNGHSVVVDGDYKLVVPSEKNFKIMVTVLGTRRPLVPVSSLHLEPGQRIYMDIPISKAQN